MGRQTSPGNRADEVLQDSDAEVQRVERKSGDLGEPQSESLRESHAGNLQEHLREPESVGSRGENRECQGSLQDSGRRGAQARG